MCRKLFHSLVQRRAYSQYIATKCQDAESNYYSALAAIRREMLYAVHALFATIQQLGASQPTDSDISTCFFLNQIKYECGENDFPFDAVGSQISTINDGRLIFTCRIPYAAQLVLPRCWLLDVNESTSKQTLDACQTTFFYDTFGVQHETRQ